MNQIFFRIVMSILTIIFILLLLSFHGQTDFFYTKSAKGTTRQIEVLVTALEFFGRDIGRYPTTQERFDVLIYKPKNLNGRWQGPYLTQEDIYSYFEGNRNIKDVWGSRYIYYSPARHEKEKSYDLYSCGKNKKDDFSQGDDITSWRGADMRYYPDEKGFVIDSYFDKIGGLLIFIIPIMMIVLVVFKQRT